MRLPMVGERVEIRVVGLPDGLLPGIQLSFSIDLRGGPIVVHVPGHNRGPDNCTPHNPEQADWLDGLSDLMRPSWDCQWTLYDEEAMETFLGLLDPHLEEYKVWIG
ncbi:MAG: hypothetical protein R6U39_10320 [Candidatus Aegiribacteria sp.]